MNSFKAGVCACTGRWLRRPVAGFTLIELLIVSVVLSLLTALAVPRYLYVQGKVRVAKVESVAQSLLKAATLVKSTAVARGVVCHGAGSLPVEAADLSLYNCYPQALSAYTDGIFGAAHVNSTDGWTLAGGGFGAGASVSLRLTEAGTPTACAVTYTAATASEPAAVHTTLDGCS